METESSRHALLATFHTFDLGDEMLRHIAKD
jgi:hypothetical protein